MLVKNQKTYCYMLYSTFYLKKVLLASAEFGPPILIVLKYHTRLNMMNL